MWKIFLLLFLFSIFNLYAKSVSPWSNYQKKITGDWFGWQKIDMTNVGEGTFQYSDFLPEGYPIQWKFIVSNFGLIWEKDFNTPSKNRELIIPVLTTNLTWTNNYMVITTDTNNKTVTIECNFDDFPDEPRNITAIEGDRTVKLYWEKSTEPDVLGYNIYKTKTAGSNYIKLNSLPIKTNFYSVTGLTNGETYYFLVRSVDSYIPYLESTNTKEIEAIPGVLISVYFHLYKKREEVTNFVLLKGIGAPFSYQGERMQYDKNNWWSKKYTLRTGKKIKYVYALDTGKLEFPYTFTLPDAGYKNVTVAGTFNNWQVNANPLHRVGNLWQTNLILDSITIEYKYVADGNWIPPGFGNNLKKTNARTITIVDLGNKRMDIYDVWGVETATNQPPSQPTGLAGLPLNKQSKLWWNRNPEPDVYLYSIYRSTNISTNFSLISSTTSLFFLDSPLTNDITYYYKISAVDFFGKESTHSAIISITPSTNPSPIKITGLRANSGNNWIYILWDKSPESDITNYIIQRWRMGATTNTFSSFTNYYYDTDVTNNYTYYYRVKAKDKIGQEGEFSDIVSATPSIDPIPSKPKGLKVLYITENSVKLKWNKNLEPYVKNYKLYCYKATTNNLFSTNSTIETNYTVSGLTNGVRYYYRLKAYSTNLMESTFSDFVSAMPVPQITDLKAKTGGTKTGVVYLSFTSPKKAGKLSPSKYIVKYSTNQINDFEQFEKLGPGFQWYAFQSGSKETITVENLGSDCPSFYFVIMTIFGSDDGFSLSNNSYGVAGKFIPEAVTEIVTKKNGNIRLTIPANSIERTATVAVIKNKKDLEILQEPKLSIISVANNKANNFQYVRLIPNYEKFYDITVIDYLGNEVDIKDKLSNQLFLEIGYDENLLHLNKINPETLKMFRLSEKNKEWGRLSYSFVDLNTKSVKSYINSLGTFSILALKPADNLNNVALYPNPAIKPSDNNLIIFTKLPENCKIYIYNVAGELIKDGLVSDQTGECRWNGRDNNNVPVSSGLYIVVIFDQNNNKAIRRLAIIQ